MAQLGLKDDMPISGKSLEFEKDRMSESNDANNPASAVDLPDRTHESVRYGNCSECFNSLKPTDERCGECDAKVRMKMRDCEQSLHDSDTIRSESVKYKIKKPFLQQNSRYKREIMSFVIIVFPLLLCYAPNALFYEMKLNFRNDMNSTGNMTLTTSRSYTQKASSVLLSSNISMSEHTGESCLESSDIFYHTIGDRYDNKYCEQNKSSSNNTFAMNFYFSITESESDYSRININSENIHEKHSSTSYDTCADIPEMHENNVIYNSSKYDVCDLFPNEDEPGYLNLTHAPTSEMLFSLDMTIINMANMFLLVTIVILGQRRIRVNVGNMGRLGI